MTKKKKTLAELAEELEKSPERESEIREQMVKTVEFQKIIADHYVSPVVQAASTYGAFKHKDETFTFDGVKGVLEAQNEVLRSNDLTCVENMLLAQAHTLDMLFHKEARRAIAQQTVGQYKVHMDMAFKAQRQCRSTLEALAEIKNPRPYIQNNRAEYQQVNNGNAPSRADTVNGSRVREEKKLKSPNGLLEDKNDDEQWLDTRTPETAGGNDKKLEAVGAKYRAKD